MKNPYLKIALLVGVILWGSAKVALAVPNLQLYIEGAIFDTLTETWVTTNSNFNLQVIGANQTIFDVYLAAAVPTEETGSVTIGSTTLSPYTYGTPIMGDGSSLPTHGVYPTDYATYFLGDFGLVQTVYNMTPGETGSALGEIKTYNVSVTGFSWVHFDAYDYIVLNDNHAVFAPFSHDSEYVPEPASLLIFGSGLLGLTLRAKKRRKTKL